MGDIVPAMNRRGFLAALGLGVTEAIVRPKSYFFFGNTWRPSAPESVIVYPGESLQAALRKVASGGTIFLKEGVFEAFGFEIYKDIHIVGEGADKTTLDFSRKWPS